MFPLPSPATPVFFQDPAQVHLYYHQFPGKRLIADHQQLVDHGIQLTTHIFYINDGLHNGQCDLDRIAVNTFRQLLEEGLRKSSTDA